MMNYYKDIVYFLPYLKFAEGAHVPDPLDGENQAVYQLNNLKTAIDRALTLTPQMREDGRFGVLQQVLTEYAKGPAAAVQFLQSGRLCDCLEKLL